MTKYDFIEDHTALSDAEIESQILIKALKKGKLEPIIIPFPFRELGTTYDYVLNKKMKYRQLLYEAVDTYLETITDQSAYYTKIENILMRLSD